MTDDFYALLIDLDGVLYVEDTPVPGALAAVAALRATGAALRFVTNTTARPRRAILERLQRLGFDLEPSELITPATLAVRRCADAAIADAPASTATTWFAPPASGPTRSSTRSPTCRPCCPHASDPGPGRHRGRAPMAPARHSFATDQPLTVTARTGHSPSRSRRGP
jgi:hypothetical protein